MAAIDHCVFFKRAEGVPDNDVAGVMDVLASITNRLDGASEFRSSANVSPEGLQQGFDHGFIIRFVDENARNAYLEDLEHKAAGTRLIKLVKGGVAGLIVVDLEV